jgi:hypothetical protein
VVVCWPDAAAAAYQQAADLGSDSAAQDLDSLHFGAFLMGAPRGDVQEISTAVGDDQVWELLVRVGAAAHWFHMEFQRA